MKIKKDIWNTLEKPFFVLAPMEGVTDIAFRQVIAKAGRPDIFLQNLLMYRATHQRKEEKTHLRD